MPSYFLDPLVLKFSAFRMVLALLTLAALYLLWRRPRVGAALALVVAVHVVSWWAYRWPLQRSYGLQEASDRGFNLGMWACVTEGLSPFEHTQRGFSSPEPLWNVLVPLLALGRIELVVPAYDLLTPLSLLAVACGIFFGMRPAHDPHAPASAEDEDRWERLLMVFAVLGLSSLSFAPRTPVPQFWIGNFMLKPHHACAFGLVAVIAGLRARTPRRVLLTGVLLGLLGWAYLMSWAYLLPGLALAALLAGLRAPVHDDDPRAAARVARALRPVAAAAALSVLLLVPYVLHLTRDFNPLHDHRAAKHMWNDLRGLLLAVPTWTTLDLGALLGLGALGMFVWWRRRTPRDVVLLGVVGGAWLLWLLSVPAAFVGLAPEPDELHYYVRFGTALAAGTALANLARWAAGSLGLARAHAAVAALALALPLAFPFYWDPPTMDRYYPRAMQHVPPKARAYGRWIRDNTRPGAVFVTGRVAATWIPLLGGRQVLLAEGGQLRPRDFDERKRIERILLFSDDRRELRDVMQRYGLDYVAVDEGMLDEYERDALEELAREGPWRTVYVNSALRIVELELELADEGAARRPETRHAGL